METAEERATTKDAKNTKDAAVSEASASSANVGGHRATTRKRELKTDGAVAPVHHLARRGIGLAPGYLMYQSS